MDVLALLNEEMGELPIQMDHSITLCFGVTWDDRVDWTQSKQSKLVFLIDLIGSALNLTPIFDSEDDFCTAVRHEVVGKNLLACSAADLPLVEEWIEFFDEAGVEDEDCDGCLTEGNAKKGNSVCYADHIDHLIHRKTSDAMAALERRLDGVGGVWIDGML